MNELNFKSILVLFIGMVFFWSCATIITGTSQEIGISSTPSYAKVIVDGKELGVTPLFAKLSKRKTHTVRIELNGYLPYEITLNKKLNGWILGNLLIGGLIGIVIDVASGGMYTLTPKQIEAELKKNETGIYKIENGIFITTVLHPDPNWYKIGNLTKVSN